MTLNSRSQSPKPWPEPTGATPAGEVSYCGPEDFTIYPGIVRETFLAPAFLKNENYTVYKSFGIAGITPPHYILALNEYQGFKLNQELFSSPLLLLNQRIENKMPKSGINSKKRSKSYGNAQLVPLLDSLRQRRYTSYDQQRKASDPTASMSLLPMKNAVRSRFDVLASLERDQDWASSDDNAIDDNINGKNSSNQIKMELQEDTDSNCADEMDQDEALVEDQTSVNHPDHLNFGNEAFDSSSDEEYFLPPSQRYGYPYTHKVPVIDIIVSDEEIEETMNP